MNKKIILIIIIVILILGALFFITKNALQENSNQVGNNTNTDEMSFPQLDGNSNQVVSMERPPMPPQ